MPDNKHDIFISYSRHDLERVKVIKRDVELTTGASCWMDLEGIESGEQFEKVIISAINRSDTMLFMLSKSSMNSEWALDELDFAKKKKKRIVIVHLEAVEQTDQFYFRYHKYDQIKWNDKAQREKLFRDICLWIGKDQESGSRLPKDGVSKESKYIRFQNFLKNKKGCSITISIVLLLVIAYVPLKNLMFSRNSKSSVHSTIDIESASPTMDDAKCKSVDLGLPSGTLWGDRNVGANSIHSTGYFFSWGDVNPIEDYKICDVIKNAQLSNIASTSHDVATKFLGNEWSLPTAEQFEELISSCKWEWSNFDDRMGYQITGPNGNMLFLPAAGCVFKKDGYKYYNKFGYYWTSESTKNNSNNAKELLIGKNDISIIDGQKYVGRSVRAVTKKL